MKRGVKKVLGLIAGGAAMLALDRKSRRAGSRGSRVRALLERVRPAPVADDTIETRVRKKLAQTASDPRAITVAIEHGCVDLRGPIETRERARIVKAVATVPGVDSVLDLMTEPHAPAFDAALVPPPAPSRGLAHRAGAWRWPARILAAGAGFGLAIAVLSVSRMR